MAVSRRELIQLSVVLTYYTQRSLRRESHSIRENYNGTFNGGVNWNRNIAVALRVVRCQIMSRRLGML